MKHKVVIADLTHTGSGISANTFPLGTAFVASYAQEVLGNSFEFQLHKFPQELADSISLSPPTILAFAKKQFPNIVVIAGGPGFPVADNVTLDPHTDPLMEPMHIA